MKVLHVNTRISSTTSWGGDSPFVFDFVHTS